MRGDGSITPFWQGFLIGLVFLLLLALLQEKRVHKALMEDYKIISDALAEKSLDCEKAQKNLLKSSKKLSWRTHARKHE